MPRSALSPLPAARVAATIGLVLLLGAAVAGCGKNSTSPGLDRTGSVTGTVLRADSSAASDADVYLWSLFDIRDTRELFVGFADAQGHFSFTGLVPGPYVVYANTPANTVSAESLAVATGSTATSTLVLVPGGAFTGLVTLDNTTDHRGTIITAEGIFALAVTDSLGHYRLDGIPPGTWTLAAAHPPGYGNATFTGTLPVAGDSVTLAPRTLTHLAPAP